MLIGDIDIHPISDGTFRASPAYFGDHARPDGHEDRAFPLSVDTLDAGP